MTGLSAPQYIATVLVANVAALFSLLGSFVICLAAWKKRQKLYHRLLFALSVSDMLSSAGIALHPWLMPRGTPNLVWAQGNDATCSAIGFTFVVFLLLVSSYNCLLSLMFLLTVRYKWKDEEFRNRLERPAHVVFILFALYIGLSGVITKTFKPTILINTCWIGDCSTFDLYNEGKCPDTVINYGWALGWVSVAAVTLNTIVAIASTALVYHTVQAQTRSNRTFAFQGTVNELAQQREREVVNQAIAYTVIYFNTFLWVFIAGILLGDDVWLMEHEGEPALYTYQILTWTFVPSQGLMNFFVYTRPTLIKWRRAFPNRSRLWALWKASSLEHPPRSRAARPTNTTSSSGAARKSLFGGVTLSSLGTALQSTSSLFARRRQSQESNATVAGVEQRASPKEEEKNKQVLSLDDDAIKAVEPVDCDDDEEQSPAPSDETDGATVDQTNSSSSSDVLLGVPQARAEEAEGSARVVSSEDEVRAVTLLVGTNSSTPETNEGPP